MAQRPRRMTTEAVLEELELEDDFDMDEPMMPGSDDEFSDCDLDENEKDDEGDTDEPMSSQPLPATAGVFSQSSPFSSPLSSPLSSPPSQWSSNLSSVPISNFTSPVGPTTPVPDSPSKVFELMFTPSLMDTIVQQTNLYAKEVMGDEKYAAWEKVTLDELKAYLGFSILMGINRLPALDDYWSSDHTLRYSPIADRISRDRFREISRYLHFADNSTLVPKGSPGYDRLGKVRPVIDHLSKQFADIYEPHKEVAVDEAMIKFTGRSAVKQYMPMKPVKRGIKVWVLADSHNGYFHTFQVYTGKEGSAEKQLGQRVVKDLTRILKGKNHHVFFDNFFTSEQLLQDLLDDGILSCGTARKDRKGFPSILKEVKLKNRYAKYLQTEHT